MIKSALKKLGIERFVLAIHDASFPADPRDDLGRGQPYSLGGRAFLRYVASLGFDGVQLGPQGETTLHDPSPYDSTLFTRNSLSIAAEPLVRAGLLTAEELAAAVAQRPSGYAQVFHAQRALLDLAYARRSELTCQSPKVRPEYEAFDALARKYGTDDWRQWSSSDAPVDASRLRFEQHLAHEQHAQFRAEANALGLKLYGDLQIGFSHRDAWCFRDLLLKDLRMGAPPSRTNPEGQPWNYPVLDPDNPKALELMRERVDKLLREYDGIRVDHPHGIIDPWVYRAEDVQRGTRLHSSPDLLPQYAIARNEQIDWTQPRHADGWVRDLDDAQVARYARIFELIVARQSDVICEVLSTQPYPVARVLQRYGLGRFRVTQKVGLDDPRDVYRSENAQPQDWIMVGNHDTPPLRAVVRRWLAQGTASKHAEYLSQRLQQRVSADFESLCDAKLAELFIGPARNVMIFFSDLFGLEETYNEPGVVSERNWSLRVPPDYARREGGRLERALALALKMWGLNT